MTTTLNLSLLLIGMLFVCQVNAWEPEERKYCVYKGKMTRIAEQWHKYICDNEECYITLSSHNNKFYEESLRRGKEVKCTFCTYGNVVVNKKACIVLMDRRSGYSEYVLISELERLVCNGCGGTGEVKQITTTPSTLIKCEKCDGKGEDQPSGNPREIVGKGPKKLGYHKHNNPKNICWHKKQDRTQSQYYSYLPNKHSKGYSVALRCPKLRSFVLKDGEYTNKGHENFHVKPNGKLVTWKLKPRSGKKLKNHCGCYEVETTEQCQYTCVMPHKEHVYFDNELETEATAMRFVENERERKELAESYEKSRWRTRSFPTQTDGYGDCDACRMYKVADRIMKEAYSKHPVYEYDFVPGERRFVSKRFCKYWTKESDRQQWTRAMILKPAETNKKGNKVYYIQKQERGKAARGKPFYVSVSRVTDILKCKKVNLEEFYFKRQQCPCKGGRRRRLYQSAKRAGSISISQELRTRYGPN